MAPWDPAPTAKPPACWVCGSLRSGPYKERTLSRALAPADLKITDANYGATLALRRCAECGFIYADGDDTRELFGLYERLSDDDYEATQGVRTLQMRWLLSLAERARPFARSALDVGAATGLLTRLVAERGWIAEGVEPSRELVSVAERVHGVRLRQGTLPHPELAGREFDVVFLVDVIEHVADPVDLLRSARAHLAPGGVAIVVTPDVASVPRKVLRSRWWHFRLAHVGYFDVRSFQVACERAGLAVERRERARWFFELGYLFERVARYLPGRSMARAFASTRLAKDTVVPLNLFDSWVFLCRRSDER